MATSASRDEKGTRFPWWTLLPVEQAVVLGLACLAAPGVRAVYLLSQHRLVLGAGFLCAWVAGLSATGRWAYRRYARHWITGGLVAAVLIVGVAVLVLIAGA